jgi:hypothetical protein
VAGFSGHLELGFPGSRTGQEPTLSNGREMRRLNAKWQQNTGWPKRLEWIEIDGLRGWAGQRLSFGFPIMAIVGENGSGKSTVLQCAASTYRPVGSPRTDESWFASDFFRRLFGKKYGMLKFVFLSLRALVPNRSKIVSVNRATGGGATRSGPKGG